MKTNLENFAGNNKIRHESQEWYIYNEFTGDNTTLR